MRNSTAFQRATQFIVLIATSTLLNADSSAAESGMGCDQHHLFTVNGQLLGDQAVFQTAAVSTQLNPLNGPDVLVVKGASGAVVCDLIPNSFQIQSSLASQLNGNYFGGLFAASFQFQCDSKLSFGTLASPTTTGTVALMIGGALGRFLVYVLPGGVQILSNAR